MPKETEENWDIRSYQVTRAQAECPEMKHHRDQLLRTSGILRAKECQVYKPSALSAQWDCPETMYPLETECLTSALRD